MRIDKNETFAGLPILKVRDALRKHGRQPFSAAGFAHSLKGTEEKTQEVIAELVARGWLMTAEDWGRPDYFQTTVPGNAFCAASALKAIPRAKADKLLAEFLQRVEQVNANDALTHYIKEVWLFGSYADGAAEVGDIDLALDMKQREIPGRDIVEHTIQRATESGKNFKTYVDMLAYGEVEVYRLLRGRSPYISLLTMRDLEATGSVGKPIYSASERA